MPKRFICDTNGIHKHGIRRQSRLQGRRDMSAVVKEKQAKKSVLVPALKPLKKDVKVQARMDSELKQAAEEVFQELGVSATEAIRMFYTQVKLQQGIPFALKIPNAVTLAAIEEAENAEALETIEDVDNFFDSL
ncbi:MAG: type II toxin-antitoxin system RelB/DinJ family antitoxin [Phormidesmis sp.]